MASRKIENALVIDLEATCWRNQFEREGQTQEIIEVGAVLVYGFGRPAGLRLSDEYQTFVRPGESEVSQFCTDLTGITQDDVKDAPSWETVASHFKKWADNRGAGLWFSWGDFDRKLISRMTRLTGAVYPVPNRHMNLKLLWALLRGDAQEVGVGQALRRAGKEFEGDPHRALDDAKMISKLLQQMSVSWWD